eukprot:Tbor_TRINITY_DN734_c0_g1::TRINITY_DN734_c0_g1_i1::g.3319::m.3319
MRKYPKPDSQPFDRDPMGDDGGFPTDFPPMNDGMPKPSKVEPFILPSIGAGTYALVVIFTIIPVLLIFKMTYDLFLKESYFSGLSLTTVIIELFNGNLVNRLKIEIKKNETEKMDDKAVLDSSGKPLEPRLQMINVSMKVKLTSVVLRARRHHVRGLMDIQY